MNDRIKKLAEQAGWSDSKLFATWNKVHQWQNFDKEKFAQLIVQECIEACNENNKQVHAHLGISVCVKSIRQRFGITE